MKTRPTPLLRLAALAAATAGAGPAALAADALVTSANGIGILAPTDRTASWITSGGRTVLVPANFVYVPPGPFTFGTGTTATTVTLDGYCIGRFEVTNAEWKAFLNATGSTSYPSHWTGGTYPAGKANHPVLYVSLTQAQQYCAWLSTSTGRTFTIPTSEQWEKAARGPEGYLYPGGNTSGLAYDRTTGVLTTSFSYNGVTAAYYLYNLPTLAVTYDNTNSPWYGVATTVSGIAGYASGTPASPGTATLLSISSSGSVSGWVNHTTYTGFIYTSLFSTLSDTGGNTAPVGSYPTGMTGYGCYDVAGNVWEWTTTLITATNGAEAGQTVNDIRGGSWYATSTSCRLIGIGEGRSASGKFNTVGFRVALTLPTDTDGDGLPDTWETARGTSATTADASADPDGDGATNLAEYVAGTDPRSALSRFAITAIEHLADRTLRVTWDAIAGKTYHLATSVDLKTWTPLTTTYAATTTGPLQAVLAATDADRLFVRAEVDP